MRDGLSVAAMEILCVGAVFDSGHSMPRSYSAAAGEGTFSEGVGQSSNMPFDFFEAFEGNAVPLIQAHS